VLIVLFLPGVCPAQSEQAVALLKEASAILNGALSRADLEKAAAKCEEALKLCERAKSEKCAGYAANQAGYIFTQLGQYPKALEYYEKSLAIKKKLGDLKGEGVTLNNIAGRYESWGQYPKALEYYEKSLAIGKKLGDLKGEGVTLSNISLMYLNWGRYSEALEYSEKSLAITRKIGDTKQEGVTLNNIAGVNENLGQYAKAIEYYEKSLEMARKTGDTKQEGTTLNNIALAYSHWGQYPKALTYYEKSLEIRQKLGHLAGEGVTLHNIAGMYCHWGQYTKALEHYQKSLELARRIGDTRLEGATLNNIATVYSYWGQYTEALEFYELGLAVQKKAGVPYSGTEDSIGNVYLSMGNVPRAEPMLKKASRWSSLGRLALAKADFNDARLEYELQLQRSLQNRNVQGLFTGHTGLGLAYEGLSKYAQAADHFRQAIALTEEIRNSLAPFQRANFYEAQVLHVPRITPYEGLTRVLLQSGKGEQALRDAAESTKARAFSESLAARSLGVALDVPRDVIYRDTDITNKLAAILQGLQKAQEKGSKDAIESFEKQVKELRAERDAHVKKLRLDYPLFAATKYPQPVAVEETAIKADEWIVEYQVTETGIAIFLLHGKKLEKALFKPVPRKELEALVRKFREPLEVTPGKDTYADKLKSFNFGTGKRLSDLLLSDILTDLPKDAGLIVIPDGCLGVLPFEMLVLNDAGKIATDKKLPYIAGAEFFGDRNPISYYQSVTALTLARTLQKQGRGSDRLFVMADPVFQLKDQRAQGAKPTKIAEADKKFYSELMATMEDPQGGKLRFNRLPLTGELATSLNDLFKGQSDCYTGVDATKETLLKTIAPKMDRYGKVVFATHGYFNKNNPGFLEPILALTMVPPGTDGFLRMGEVMGLKLNADIVALTACQTGLGRNISGEGTMGMGRAFQYAGAKSVLMSLWNVEQKASVQLVEGFFKHRKAGNTKLEALRLARQEIRDAGYDHPFFWAPFILVGETD